MKGRRRERTKERRAPALRNSEMQVGGQKVRRGKSVCPGVETKLALVSGLRAESLVSFEAFIHINFAPYHAVWRLNRLIKFSFGWSLREKKTTR
jgi:hypothetical protein